VNTDGTSLAIAYFVLFLSVLGIPSALLYLIRRDPQSDIIVPGWIGWAAVASFLAFSLFAWAAVCAFAYFRGKSDSRSIASREPPRGNPLLSAVGWSVVGFALIFVWYALVHAPTMLYREGVRNGAATADSSAPA